MGISSRLLIASVQMNSFCWSLHISLDNFESKALVYCIPLYFAQLWNSREKFYNQVNSITID